MPSQGDLRRTSRRITISATLWAGGVALGFIGNWLHWEWLAVPAPLPFPDQIWGDRAGSTVENAVLIVSLVLGILMFWMWRSTGSRHGRRPSPTRMRTMQIAGQSVRWVTVAFSILVLASISVLLFHYLRDWWTFFPGWLAEWFAQLCILIAALTLPPLAGEHRRQERERDPKAYGLAAVILLVAITAPFGIGALVDTTQNQFHVSTGADPDENAIVSTYTTTTGAGIQLVSPEEEILWDRSWRGAKDIFQLPAINDDTVAVSLSQATTTRPALVLLDQADGGIRARLSALELNRLQLDLRIDPSEGEYVVTYGDTLLRTGPRREWVSPEGIRFDGPPTEYMDAVTAAMTPIDGVHGMNLVSGETWFVGDGSGCARRIASFDEQPIMTEDGVILMTQICDEHAAAEDSWSFPGELTGSISPLSAALFGLDAQTGAVLWQRPLTGFGDWAATTGARYPSSELDKLPLTFQKDPNASEVLVIFADEQFPLDLASGGN